MFNKIKLTLSLLFAGLAFGHLNAQEDYTTSEEDVQISEASEPEPVDASLMVEEMMEEYLNHGKGKAIKDKVGKDGGWYGSASATVSVKPENPHWGEYRVMAYKKALSDLESQYLLKQYQTIKTKKVNKFYKNIYDDAPDYQEDEVSDNAFVDRMFKKVLAVAEGKLDQMLDEYEIDKEAFYAAPEAQRHTMLSQSFLESTIVESFGSLAGMIPIQTFEGYNETGDHSIGVVCIVTPKLRQFAYDVIHRHGNIEPTAKTGEDLYEKFSSQKELLIDQFGIRKMIDKDGYPVLVSFGQWSNSHKTNNSAVNATYRKAAKDQAAAQAKSQMVVYLAGKSMYQSETIASESMEAATNVHQDGFKEDEVLNEIHHGIDQVSETKANLNISGLVPLYTWTVKHPEYGHEIVGSIYAWSPKTEMDARKLKEWKPNAKPKPDVTPTPAPEQKGEKGNKQGQDYMDLDDF